MAPATAPVDRPSRPGPRTRLAFITVFFCAAMSCASWAQEPGADQDKEIVQQVATDRTVVLAFPLSAPQTQIDAVGKHYGLQLVERKVSQVLDQHLIVYRVPADRDANDLVRQLATDTRIASAQFNRQYGPVDPAIRVPLVARTTPREKVARAQASPTVKSREGNPADRLPKASSGMAKVAAVAPTRTSSLGSGMRWPTADEPFLGLGGRNR